MNYYDAFWNVLKLAICFYLLFIFIPSKIISFKEPEFDRYDKFFISLIHSNLIIILLVHAFSFLKIMEYFSIILAVVSIVILILYYRSKSMNSFLDNPVVKSFLRLMDFTDKKDGARRDILSFTTNIVRNILRRFRNGVIWLVKNPFEGVIVAVILFIAAYIRFFHSITHYYFASYDAYVHLAWAKYIGNNDIYHLGEVYPNGYNAIVSALNRIFFIDPYYVIRFLGPLGGLLLVVSLLFGLKKLVSIKPLIILCLGIYVFYSGVYVASSGLPSYVWRQISALPMEYSAIFFIPGIYYFGMFFKNRKKLYLLLSAEVVALTALIHPFSLFFVGVAYIFILLFNFRKVFTKALFFGVLKYLLAALAVGFLPILIGLARGGHFQNQSVDYFTSSFNASSNKVGWFTIILNNMKPWAVVYLISVLFIYICIIIRLLSRKHIKVLESHSFHLVFILTSFVALFNYFSYKLGLPSIIPWDRAGVFLSLLIVIIFGMSIKIIADCFLKYRFTKPILSVISILMILSLFVINSSALEIPIGTKVEYDQAVKSYLSIKANYPSRQWTIISTVEQYQEALGNGYHTNLWQFVDNIEKKISESTTFTTPDVFLFVEKIPLGFNTEITKADANSGFPVISGSNLALYYQGESRRILEAKAFYWGEEYMKTHSNASIYFDDKYFRVYRIEKQDKKLLELLK